MDAIHAALRASVERVEFHDAAGEIGIAFGLDLEAEAGAADPFDTRAAVLGLGLYVAGLGIPAGPKDIIHATGDTAADINARIHKRIPAARSAGASRTTAARRSAGFIAQSRETKRA